MLDGLDERGLLLGVEQLLWPPDRPLPYPTWGGVARRLFIDSMERFETLVERLTECVRRQLTDHCYNTIGNFLTFHESFRRRADGSQTLESFFRGYRPPITARHHTCVGLGLDLMERILALRSHYPDIASALFLSSCEEDIGNVHRYVTLSAAATPDRRTSEKEHVVVTLLVELDGRQGVLLLDPGYHVAAPVVVMKDQLAPHTGWFKPGGTQRSRRTYNYTLHPSGRYVEWNVRETRRGVEECESALIYIHQAFLAPVECTERRNLVYNFKSLLRRDADGRVVAGVYFAIKALRRGHFSLFYVDEATQRQVDFKVSIDAVLEGGVGADQAEAVRRCERRLRPGGGSLAALLERTAAALADAEFLPQLLDINERVVVLAQNN